MSSGLSPRRLAKRTQIASAARELFLAQGVAATSMDAVTTAAGVSKQTLYSYFPTKLELLTSVVTEEVRRLQVTAPAMASPATTAELRAVLLAFFTGIAERVMVPETIALLRLVLGEAFDVPELREMIRQAIPGQILPRVESLIEQSAARGIIATPDPRLSARMFVGPVMSFVILDGVIRNQEIEPPGRADMEFIVDAFLATVAVRS